MSESERRNDAEKSGVRHRVFYALWPDEETRASLARATRHAVRRCGGRPIRRENLHITLAFLGSVDETGLQRALDLPSIEIPPFELELDRLGFWPHARILWIGPSRLPRELAELERALWAALSQRGFVREPRPYQAHLTLARHARAVAVETKPVRWQVRDFALMESTTAHTGSRYRLLSRWPLFGKQAREGFSAQAAETARCRGDESVE